MLEESKDNKDELALNILRELLGLFVPIPTFLLEFTTRASPPTVKRDEKRFVEDAVVAKLFVVVALVPVAEVNIRFGNVLLVVVVAVKFAPTISPTTESLAYGEVVPMPRLPVLKIVSFIEPLVPKINLSSKLS